MYRSAPKKKKTAKQMKSCEGSVCGDTQHKVPKVVEENKKIKPKEVFGDNYTKGRSQSDTYTKGRPQGQSDTYKSAKSAKSSAKSAKSKKKSSN